MVGIGARHNPGKLAKGIYGLKIGGLLASTGHIARKQWFRRAIAARGGGDAEAVQHLTQAKRGLRFPAGARSFDFFIRIDAPQIRLLDKAIEAVARDTAPGAVATAHACDHIWLQLR